MNKLSKQEKNGLIDVVVSFLWTVMVIFFILGGFSMSNLINNATTMLEWMVGFIGMIIYLGGCFIVWYFAFNSINERHLE